MTPIESYITDKEKEELDLPVVIPDQEERIRLLGEYEAFWRQETSRISQLPTSRSSETIVNPDNNTTQAPIVEQQDLSPIPPLIPEDDDIYSVISPGFDIDSSIQSQQPTENDQTNTEEPTLPQPCQPENQPHHQDHILNGNYLPNFVQPFPPEHPIDDRHCQPQTDLAKPSTPRTLETIVKITILDSQPESQPGKLHQQPEPASTSSSSDQGDHVVRGNSSHEHDHQSQPLVQIANQPKSVQRVRYMTEHTHQQLAGQDELPITSLLKMHLLEELIGKQSFAASKTTLTPLTFILIDSIG